MDCKIGCSIAFNVFSESSLNFCNAFGGKNELLAFLRDNVNTVELRSVDSSCSSDDVLNAVKLLHSYGIKTTIHATLAWAKEFFVPYEKLFSARLQSVYNLTVHPAQNAENTKRMLQDVCWAIEENGYPAYITLENQRKKTATDFGTCEDVAQIVKEISSPHLGLCFDFGHQLSNEYKYQTDFLQDEFLKRVKHTHIHSLYQGVTHYPLHVGETALERNISALLQNGYEGVFSLELSPNRYQTIFNEKDALVESIHLLKNAIEQVQLKKQITDFYKNNYLQTLKNAKRGFDCLENCIVLIGHAGYLIKLGATRFAVDIAPNNFPISDEAKEFILDWIKDFDGYIVTHEHGDHYDRKFYQALPKHLKKFMPDFMNVGGENTQATYDGATVLFKDINLSFFESGHSGGGKSVLEYGFVIERKSRKYVFLGDVRNYAFKYPSFGNVHALFSHLWLGRSQALVCKESDYVRDFCSLVNGFHAKENYIAHFYDVHRPIEDMWSALHFALIKPHVPNVNMLTSGDLIEL